jgi:hypothetical protein
MKKKNYADNTTVKRLLSYQKNAEMMATRKKMNRHAVRRG